MSTETFNYSPLPHYAVIAVSGPDNKKFLQGQLTCNMEHIDEKRSCLGLHCTPKGRVIADYRLWLWDGIYYLALNHEIVDSALAALQKYAVFSQVCLSPQPEQQLYGLSGNKNLYTLFDNLPNDYNQVSINHDALVTKIPGDENNFILLGKQPQKFIEAHQLNSQKVSASYFQLLDIKEKIAHITPEIQEKFTPHALGYHLVDAVSFDKGCYTGQEIVARMHFLGKLKDELHHIVISSSEQPKADTPLLSKDEKNVGTLINVLKTEEDKSHCLANIKKKFVEENDVYWQKQPTLIIL